MFAPIHTDQVNSLSEVNMDQPRLIDIPTLKERLGIRGNATVYRRIKDDPRFPRPVKVGNLTRFVDADVTRYIEELASEADLPRRPAPAHGLRRRPGERR